jgi:hypothetical protein
MSTLTKLLAGCIVVLAAQYLPAEDITSQVKDDVRQDGMHITHAAPIARSVSEFLSGRDSGPIAPNPRARTPGSR